MRVALDGDVPAAHAGLLVRDDVRPFALVGRWAGAAALAGGEPLRVADAEREDPFALLDEQPPLRGELPAGFVGGGWFGALGYGLGRRLETLGPPPPAPAGERLPSAMLAFYDHLLRCDAEGQWWFEALWSDARADMLGAAFGGAVGAGCRGRRRTAARGVRTVAGEPVAGGTRPRGGGLPRAHRRRRPLPGEPVAAVARERRGRCRRPLHPRRGRRWARIAGRGSPGRGAAVASLSPELFVARTDEIVRTAPIKGTRPRPADAVAAEAQRTELAGAAKDRAENVMIVDLMRNDLGRVCEPGSIAVTALAEVRPHAGVWHLVSEVYGRRRQM